MKFVPPIKGGGKEEKRKDKMKTGFNNSPSISQSIFHCTRRVRKVMRLIF